MPEFDRKRPGILAPASASSSRTTLKFPWLVVRIPGIPFICKSSDMRSSPSLSTLVVGVSALPLMPLPLKSRG
jgi:hypothetical protein